MCVFGSGSIRAWLFRNSESQGVSGDFLISYSLYISISAVWNIMYECSALVPTALVGMC